MSYSEKKQLVMIFSTILILAAYLIYTIGKYQSGILAADDLQALATTMLVFVGISIAAMIIVQIIFHILLSIGIAVKESIKNGQCEDEEIGKKIEQEMVEDERDKAIQRRGTTIGYVVVGIGFIAALVSLALNATPLIMLNILFISFFVGSITDSITQLYFYKRGINHG